MHSYFPDRSFFRGTDWRCTGHERGGSVAPDAMRSRRSTTGTANQVWTTPPAPVHTCLTSHSSARLTYDRLWRSTSQFSCASTVAVPAAVQAWWEVLSRISAKERCPAGGVGPR